MNEWYHFIIIATFAICGIARLAHFNVSIEDNSKPVKYYTGLPVTYTAMIFPLFYLLSYVIPFNIFTIIYTILIAVVAMLNILKIKIIKPKGVAYLIFPILAIITLVLYLGVL